MYKQQIFQTDKQLPESYRWQILSFLRYNFPDGFLGDNEGRDWLHNPQDKPIHITISTDNNILISYCAVVQKLLKHNKQSYLCYGLTGVMTYPPFRSKGFGNRVVEMGTQIIKNSNADIGLFNCAKELKDFYAKSGWIPMEKSTTLVGKKDNPLPSNELLMMLFLSDKAISKKSDFENIPIYFGEDT